MGRATGCCAVIDYGVGNLHSVAKALMRVAPNMRVDIVAEPEAVAAADRLVLPGVGSIAACMDALSATGMSSVLLEHAAAGKPLLAICVGMQLLMEFSEENGGRDGLGLLPGRVQRFVPAPASGIKVPHMGWNTVIAEGEDSPMLSGIESGSYFYFVHSYYAPPNEATVARSEYGLPFAAAMSRDAIVAVQFHPEKSGAAGLRLLANFAVF